MWCIMWILFLMYILFLLIWSMNPCSARNCGLFLFRSFPFPSRCWHAPPVPSSVLLHGVSSEWLSLEPPPKTPYYVLLFSPWLHLAQHLSQLLPTSSLLYVSLIQSMSWLSSLMTRLVPTSLCSAVPKPLPSTQWFITVSCERNQYSLVSQKEEHQDKTCRKSKSEWETCVQDAPLTITLPPTH